MGNVHVLCGLRKSNADGYVVPFYYASLCYLFFPTLRLGIKVAILHLRSTESLRSNCANTTTYLEIKCLRNRDGRF